MMKKITKVLIALLLFAATAQASLTVIEEQTLDGGGQFGCYAGFSCWQKFKTDAGETDVTQAEIQSKSAGSITWNVSILTDSGGTPTTALASSGCTYATTSDVGAAFAWRNVTFNTPCNITAGTDYWLYTGCPTCGVNGYTMNTRTPENYRGAAYFAKQDANYVAYDYMFKLWANESVVPAGNIATTALSSPAANDHDDNFTGTFVNTWYAANYTTACTLYANGTASGTNSTAVVNATAYSITNNTLQGNGFYNWYVGCLQNDTTWANSTARNFYLDTTAPTITIYSPLNGSSHYYYDTITKNATFTDNIGLFNCTQEIYYPNGTLADTDSLACSGLSVSWANQTFTASVLGDWWANYSAMDSHTANENPVKVIKNDVIETVFENPGKGKFKTKAGLLSDKDSYSVTYSMMADRIKWDIHISLKNARKNWNVTIPIESECPIYMIAGTPYAGHGVTCGAWFDFDDAFKSGWGVYLSANGSTAATVTLTRSFSNAEKSVVIDPAVGGLNLGFSTANFTVIDDSGIAVNNSAFYVSSAGYIMANYYNVSDNAIIAGATCTGTMADPYGGVDALVFGEQPAYYIVNYTPMFEGAHTYNITCTKAAWHPETIGGTISVILTPPSYTIGMNMASSDEATARYCSGSNLIIEWNRTACVGASCTNTMISQTVACPNSCYAGACAMPPENYTWLAIGVVIALIILLIALGLS
jgi:hypothetical protein